jgi:2-polyprenyl-3-methyl-5-hydroxy-6-metoxy-1,4-benzoquinol methylase
MTLYANKPGDYFAHARMEIEPLLNLSKGSDHRVLEIGCGEGATLEWLKQSGYCNWVAGVEPYASRHPDTAVIDQFECLNIELNMPNIKPGTLDLILCLDVLEHLNNPWEVMGNLSKLLKPGGRWIISVPNIRNYRVLMDLAFRGRFRYTEAGILDRTHLRFFTRESLVELVNIGGSRVETIIGADTNRWQKRLLSKIGLGDLLAKQFLLSAVLNAD